MEVHAKGFAEPTHQQRAGRKDSEEGIGAQMFEWTRKSSSPKNQSCSKWRAIGAWTECATPLCVWFYPRSAEVLAVLNKVQ